MLLKALAIVQSKAVLAALGVVLVGGGGTAAAYAATSHPSALTSTFGYGSAAAPATPATTAAKPTMATTKPAPTSGATNTHAHSMAIRGVLKAYNANAGTITVQVKGSVAVTTIAVNAKTRVNGIHVRMLGDLARNIGHKVEVQATKQGDGKLVARTLTVQRANAPAGGNTSGTGTIPDIGDSPAMGTTPTPTTGTNAGTGNTSGTGTIPDIGDSPAMGTTPATGNNPATGTNAGMGTIPDIGDSPAMGTTPTPTTGNNPGMGNSHGNGSNSATGKGNNSNG